MSKYPQSRSGISVDPQCPDNLGRGQRSRPGRHRRDGVVPGQAGQRILGFAGGKWNRVSGLALPSRYAPCWHCCGCCRCRGPPTGISRRPRRPRQLA